MGDGETSRWSLRAGADRTYTQSVPAAEWRRWMAAQTRWQLANLQSLARAEHAWGRAQEGLARSVARGAGRGAGAYVQSRQVESMQREADLQQRISSAAGSLGLADAAAEAQGALERLRSGITSLGVEMQRTPYEEAAARLSAWDDRLAARAELLRALEAPEQDINRILEERIGVLQEGASVLQSLGQYARADRDLAQATRLAAGMTRDGRKRAAVDERVREIIGERPRNAEAIAPLAVAKAERAALGADVSVSASGEGPARRYVVEFQAPADTGNAVADAIIGEVMRRLADVLRSKR